MHPFHPIADEYPLMPSTELDALAQALAERGYWPELGKIVVLDGLILDGRNRYLAARKAGVDLIAHQIEYSGDTSDASLRLFVESANEHRRHLTPEQLQIKRQERIERVAKRRSEGASLRTIAAEEGVSPPQVLADVRAGVNPLTPETTFSGVKGLTPANEKVIGRDGKTYSASKPRKKPEQESPPEQPQEFPPDDVQQHPDDDMPVSEPAVIATTDPAGLVLIEERSEPFDPHFEDMRQKCLSLCRQLRDSLHDYAASAAGAQLRQRLSREGRTDDATRYRSKELIALTKLIQHWAPYASVCPYCHAKGASRDCGVCYGYGWVCKDAWKDAPVDYRDAVLAAFGGGKS